MVATTLRRVADFVAMAVDELDREVILRAGAQEHQLSGRRWPATIGRPRVHQLAALLEQVAALVRSLDLVADDVR
jgi:hypothetical protein